MMKTKSDDYERGYREGFLAGFHAARDNDSLMSPNIPIPRNIPIPGECSVCKIKWTDPLGRSIAMGYACCRGDCPAKSTC
jgi:hypothetical protein